MLNGNRACSAGERLHWPTCGAAAARRSLAPSRPSIPEAPAHLPNHMRDGNHVASPGTAINSSVNARMITT
jgi:hypothetical protein